ncbi:MAG: hypothetical protein LQ344_002024 [Seirophora lacunosa]|nr:MAG: hypothetical protein LQ344_002024 [Seirophora lacunosa]
MTEQKPAPPPTDDRARLKAHFNVATTSHPDRWAKLWDAGNFLPWDRGTPNPALVDLLDQRKDLIGDCFVEDAGKRRRKRALVPGCGKGYDVLLLASYGYDAYGLEVSEKAVERCVEERTANGDKYPVRREDAGMGQSIFLHGDFFDGGWSKDVVDGGTFELIYDYTVPLLRALAEPLSYRVRVADGREQTVLLRSESGNASSVGTEDVAALVPEPARTSHMPRVSHLQGSVNRRPSVWADTSDLRRTLESAREGNSIR